MPILPQTRLWSRSNISFSRFRLPSRPPFHPSPPQKRPLLTLAIETSCDDTAVAILEVRDNAQPYKKDPQDGSTSPAPTARTTTTATATLHFNEKITADNNRFRGIHPVASLLSHQKNLTTLIAKSLQSLPLSPSPSPTSPSPPLPHPSPTIPVLTNKNQWTLRQKPTFISVTRGPGMFACLSTGLDTAKGLSVAWGIPLIGINHMQAHALTPRLISALTPSPPPSTTPLTPPIITPTFPFLTLLVSGGHTLLLHSHSLTTHTILSSTTDIAAGLAIDKIARSVLPAPFLSSSGETPYGKLLETFAFPNGAADHHYTAPASAHEQLLKKQTRWGWELPVPLAVTKAGKKVWAMEYSFSGVESTVRGICDGERRGGVGDGERGAGFSVEERRELAREAMRVTFEHLASRVVLALRQVKEGVIDTLVISGGVASNQYLKTVVRAFLDARGYSHVQLSFPPPAFCTDNAAMIAWTGMEMFADGGWETELACGALKTWSVDPAAPDGGILGVSGWVERKKGRASRRV